MFKSKAQLAKRVQPKNKKVSIKKRKLSERQKRIISNNYHSSSEEEDDLRNKPVIKPKSAIRAQFKRPEVSEAPVKKLKTGETVVDFTQEPSKNDKKKKLKREQKEKKQLKEVEKTQQKEELEKNSEEDDLPMDDEFNPTSDNSDLEAEQSNEIHCKFDNPGWADVIRKILAKNPKLESNQSSVVLVKAKRDFEILEQEPTKYKSQKQRNDWENLNRILPSANDKEKERRLALIASKGVVQLFNTIRQQKLERRK